MPTDPLALDGYEAPADAYHERVATKPFDAYLERPAITSLLPGLTGERVVEAEPTGTFRGAAPEIYGRIAVIPTFLSVRARRE